MVTHTTQETRDAILSILGQVAPEADLATLEPKVTFREQLDLDSFDFLRFLVGVSDVLGVEVPEVDYPQLATLDDAIAYLSAASSRAKPKG